MSRLSDLINEAKKLNADLGTALESEVRHLEERRAFGLNFERHTPEAVDLYGRPVRKGDKVRMLPPRGHFAAPDKRIWIVTGRRDADGVTTADLHDPKTDETAAYPFDDLVVVAEQSDVIYPGLVSTGKVERGGDKPFHTVINAENLHALKALMYTHKGRIDAIYIDPPYNTGARDWKYNNDYVEGEDLYRHSKWLAFMERRLLVARELLSPTGTLVVTIDEHEVNRLGLLLSQLFPDFTQQLVTIVNNPKGVTQGYLSRVEEYAFFVFAPGAKLFSVDDDLLTHRDPRVARDGLQRPRWKGLLRSGDDSLRADRKDMFYPVWLDVETGKLVHAGEPLPLGQEPAFEANENGLRPIWPIRRDGKQGRWGVGAATLNRLIEHGFAAAGQFDQKRATWAVSYLSQQVRGDLEAGLLTVVGHDKRGVADVAYVDMASRRVRTVWHRSGHDAGAHGTDLLRSLLGTGRPFPFPKSLYAVEDTLRPLVGGKRDAIVLDFFSGSGTTAHAVMRLNRQDGGRRQSISVTNNEVSAAEHGALRNRNLREGDADWEALGICELVTKPRLYAAISGRTPDGVEIKGDYKFTDEFPMADGLEENAEFFTMTYEAPLKVASHHDFERIAPLLWLRAGAQGRRIESLGDGWDVAHTYGVIDRLECLDMFVAAIEESPDVKLAFIVTDDSRRFQTACAALPDHVEPVRLYESYLRNFQLEAQRKAR